MTSAETSTPAHAYEEYFGPAIFEPLSGAVVGRAAPQPGERALDVACGTGIVARRLAAAVAPGGAVVGVDINPGMLAVAGAHPQPAGVAMEWREGDGTNLGLATASFDLVVCQQGLQFFPDRRAGAAEMRRVLSDRGRAVVAVWQGLDRHPLYRAMAEAEVPLLEEFGVRLDPEQAAAPFSLGDAGELGELLEGAGFGTVEITQHTIDARFATPERFVERMERAYAAVVPALAEDPDAFAAFVDAVARATKSIVEKLRSGDFVVVPMHTHIAVARP